MSDAIDEDPTAIQKDFAKKQYNSLRFESLVKMFLYMVPALILTGFALSIYFGVEDQIPVIHRFYDNISDFLFLLFVIAAVICWGAFFWIQVSTSRKNAALWKQAMDNYEELIATESQLKTPEQKRLASRRAVAEAQKTII